MRKPISIALVIVLVLGLLPVAYAASHPFTDVKSDSWYAGSVEYVYTRGLMNGTTVNRFSPDNNMTRGMIVTVLHRLEKEPAASGRIPFTDVPFDAYYYDAVVWSYENGIVNGVSATRFNPEANVTREQLVTIFYRYANAKGYSTTGMDDLANSRLNDFIDVHKLQDYARNAMVWAEVNGIIKGVTETTLVPDGNATRAQFATIMQRFMQWCEKRSAPATPLTAQKDAQLHADLQADIDDILYSETEIVHSDTFIPGKTYTGTAYYVSNDGDDGNDGLTPETAWRTLTKVMELNGYFGERETMLQPGDAVLFRRGDIFRLSELGEFAPLDIRRDGITYSAYGEGEKPIITASSENGTGAEKWQLVYEDETGKKIWQYYQDMRDTSGIILNNGEAITTRVYEYYDGNGYISCEATGWWMHEAEGVTLMDKLLPLEEAMTEDLTIISRPERFSAEDKYSNDTAVGPLYLRCDAGNPGEIYDSVEFSEYYIQGIVWLSACDVVFDNISFRCSGNSYMKPAIGWKEIQNTVIQNCEFAYGGMTVTFYHEREDGAVVVEVQGDGIYNLVRNTTIRNNYFHDGPISNVTYEADVNDTDTVDGYFHYLNNVSVNTLGIRLDSTAVALQYLDSVKVCGNQVWNTGHMDQGKLVYSEGALVMMPNHYGECIVEDNVFYTTQNGHPMNALLDIFLYDFENIGYAKPRFANNTYVQYAGRNFGDFLMHGETWAMDDPELLNKAAQWLGDTTSQFYVIE